MASVVSVVDCESCSETAPVANKAETAMIWVNGRILLKLAKTLRNYFSFKKKKTTPRFACKINKNRREPGIFTCGLRLSPLLWGPY